MQWASAGLSSLHTRSSSSWIWRFELLATSWLLPFMPNQWPYISTSPPNSCHPPGILTGLIFGQVLWIFQLCSLREDIDKELSLSYKRLLNCGYLTPKLIPLFKKSITNAISYLSLSPQQELRAKIKVGKLDERIFFHIPYHPQNPSSGIIQHLWQDLLNLLPGKECLNQLRNWEGHRIPIKHFIVANYCNPNLANLDSYPKLSS
jgi:hypothetical protein